MSGHVRPRQGTEICNFGAPSPLKALHWTFCFFSSIYVQFGKTSPLKSGESSEKFCGENRVKSCHVCGCHGFFGPEYDRKGRQRSGDNPFATPIIGNAFRADGSQGTLPDVRHGHADSMQLSEMLVFSAASTGSGTECTKIPRFSAAAAAIFTAPQDEKTWAIAKRRLLINSFFQAQGANSELNCSLFFPRKTP